MQDERVQPFTPSESIPRPPLRADREARPFLILAAFVVALLLIGDAIIAHTAPLEHLLQTTQWSTTGAIHGMLGSTIFIAGSVALYLGYRLMTGRLESLRDLKTATVLTTLAAAATVIFGNWLYVGYRQPGMTQDYFLQNAPELHTIFFEFKEDIALFTIPLGAAAAFILYRYDADLCRHPWLRTVVLLLLALVFLFFLIAFALGAAITRVKPV
jgi:hypothetical protein